jgi:2,4-dienoyl-CoA reductase [(3E)-enoyl-CoA-producing], peroxisomal
MADTIFLDGILNGRVAFVTGGGTGITGGVARALAEAGASVALVSRTLEHLEPAAKAINDAHADNPNIGEAFAVAADVRNFEQIEEALLATAVRFGKVDIVVNGAAGNFLSPAEALSPNGFGTVVDIDLKGTFNVCRAAFAHLKEHRGQILNISATVEWGRYGIRVNGIAPGPIEDTEGMKRLVPEPIKEKLKKNIPLGRFGRISDIEKAAVFLCSDAAGFINGAIIVVDGGQWLAATKFV